MEKEDQIRKEKIRQSLQKQEERGKRFVDANKVREDEINKLIEKNDLGNILRETKM